MILIISFLESYLPFLRGTTSTQRRGSVAAASTGDITMVSDQYVGRPRQVQRQQPQRQEPPKKSFWGRVWGAVRSTAVILAATVVTGALIATGVGAVGVVLAIGAGIAAGTAVGAATNIATAIANGGSKQDWKECWQQTFQDFKSSCIGAVSAACGFGIAARIIARGGGHAATLGTRLFAGSMAGGGGATVSTVIGTVDQFIQARSEFNEQYGHLQITASERARLYQEFLKERGLTSDQIVRSSLVNIGTGFATGGIGARFQVAREGVQRSIAEGVQVSTTTRFVSSIGAEATTLTAAGFGSSYLTHGHISLEEAIQHVGSSYAGGYLGNKASQIAQNRAQARSQTPHGTDGRSVPPAPTKLRGTVITHEELPLAIRDSNSFRYANRNGRSVEVELVHNAPPGFKPHAEVIETVHGSKTTRTTRIVVSDLNDTVGFFHELRHGNHSSTRLPTPDPATGKLKPSDVKRYVAQRALEEFKVKSARSPVKGTGEVPHNQNVEHVRAMNRLIEQGDYTGAIRYARKNGITKTDINGYVNNIRESLRTGGTTTVKRSNFHEDLPDILRKLNAVGVQADDFMSFIESIPAANRPYVYELLSQTAHNLHYSEVQVQLKALHGMIPEGGRIVVLNPGGSGEALAYMISKLPSVGKTTFHSKYGSLPSLTEFIETSGGRPILFNELSQRPLTPSEIRILTELRPLIVELPGFNSAPNFFEYAATQSISCPRVRNRIQQIVERAQQLQAASGGTMDNRTAMQRALDHHLNENLRLLGIPESEVTRPALGLPSHDYDIYNYFCGKQITGDQVIDFLTSMPQLRPLVRRTENIHELQCMGAKLLSSEQGYRHFTPEVVMQRLGAMHRTLERQLGRFTSDGSGRTYSMKDVIIITDLDPGSTRLITHMFREYTLLPPEQFISRADALSQISGRRNPFEGRVAVYIDDCIGSGQQVVNVFVNPDGNSTRVLNTQLLRHFDHVISLPITGNPDGIAFARTQLGPRQVIAIDNAHLSPSMAVLDPPHPFRQQVRTSPPGGIHPDHVDRILDSVMGSPGYGTRVMGRPAGLSQSFFYMWQNGNIGLIEAFAVNVLGLRGST